MFKACCVCISYLLACDILQSSGEKKLFADCAVDRIGIHYKLPETLYVKNKWARVLRQMLPTRDTL